MKYLDGCATVKINKPTLVILLTLSITMVTACNTITYTASCKPEDSVCQRNQNAQTLALIGQEDAALQLMCEDKSIRDTLGDKCAGW